MHLRHRRRRGAAPLRSDQLIEVASPATNTSVPQRLALMRLRPATAPKLRAAAYPVLLLAALAATAGARYAEPSMGISAGQTTAALVTGGSSTTNEVYLPIEVMGPDGTTRSMSVHVANAAGVDSMYLVGHSLGYHNSPRLWNGTVQRDGK